MGRSAPPKWMKSRCIPFFRAATGGSGTPTLGAIPALFFNGVARYRILFVEDSHANIFLVREAIGAAITDAAPTVVHDAHEAVQLIDAAKMR